MSDPFSPPQQNIRPPGNINNLQSRITKYARDNAVSVSRLNQRLLTEVTLGLLERARDLGVIPMYMAKGGMALELRFGMRARASGDLDIGIVAGGKPLLDVLDRVLKVGFSDFTFGRADGPDLLENVQTYRVNVKVAYRGRSFGTLSVDLNEATYETATTTQRTGLLMAVGLPGPLNVHLLDLHWQIAQKLHGATEPSRLGYTNRRHRDLLDVLMIQADPTVSLDLGRLREIVIAEFARRPHHKRWPPIFSLPVEWRAELARDARNIAFPMTDPDELARQFITFIAQIGDAGGTGR